MEKIAKIIVKLRWPIIAITIAVTIFFGYEIRHIKINSDFIKSLPEDDPIAVEYKAIGEKYLGNDMGIIVMETDNIYNASTIAHIKQITDSLKTTPGVSTVTSLTDIIDIKSDTAGIEIGKLIDEYMLPQAEAELLQLKQRVDEKEMYKGVIVSEDGTETIIMFTLQSDVNQQEICKTIKEKIHGLQLPEKLHFGGSPMMLLDISEMIIADLLLLIPIIAIVLIVVLLLSFRSAKGVIYPLITVSIASVWTIGIMSLLKYDITLITGNIPVILFAVGSAYVIHVINHVKEIAENDFRKAVITSLSYIIIPVFLSAITTMFGFLSFIFGAYLTMIKDFGIFSAAGTLIALLLSLTFVPSLQTVFTPKRKVIIHSKQKKNKSFIENGILKPLFNLLFKHPKYILSIWIGIILFGLTSSFFLIRNTNIANYFKKGSPTKVSEELLQKKFGGSSPIYVVFKGDMQSPQVLKTMLDMEVFLKENPFIKTTNSVADLIKEMNDAMGEGKRITDEKAKIEQLWFLLEGQDIMPQLVDDEKQEGVIQSRFASSKTRDIEPFIEATNQWIAKNQTEDCKISLNGMPSIYSQMDKSLLKSQMTSLTLAIILVLILITIIIKSFRLGIFGIIPILSTIILLFGFMGITGIPLDIATVLVASVALGIGIDYSIHIINAYNYNKKQYTDFKTVIEKTILVSGKAIVINIASVTAGFLVLLFSQIVPMQHFGLLVAISMISSGFGALTLLPVILILNHQKSITIKS